MNQSLRKEAGCRRHPGAAPIPSFPPLRLALLCSVVALAICSPARAEEPLWGEIAETLGKGFATVTTRGSYSETKPFRHHGGAVLLTTARMDAVMAVEYGLGPNVDLRLRMPYLTETIEEKFAGQTVRHPISGMGEMQFGTKWRFWQAMDSRRKDELALVADLKLPSGDNEMRDSHGSIIPPHLQPNSGNLGASVGLAADRHTRMGGYWLSALVSAEMASQRYQRGSMLELHASTGRRVRPLTRENQTDWMGIIGLHYHLMGQEREGGNPIRDSGGSDISVELGLAGTRSTFGARLGILLPVHMEFGLAHPPPGIAIQASLRGSF